MHASPVKLCDLRFPHILTPEPRRRPPASGIRARTRTRIQTKSPLLPYRTSGSRIEIPTVDMDEAEICVLVLCPTFRIIHMSILDVISSGSYPRLHHSFVKLLG